MRAPRSTLPIRCASAAGFVGNLAGLPAAAVPMGHVGPQRLPIGLVMVGPHVTDLIAEGMLMTDFGLLAGDIARHIHPHPTLSEAIGEAALSLAGKPLHG